LAARGSFNAYPVFLHVEESILVSVNEHKLVLGNFKAGANIEILGIEIAGSIRNLVFAGCQETT
jgi:hypothetical protein